ncbi:MAG: hypothetical protein A2Y21_12015 [Clostridiales bacterium GWC2_40_7]|nr:MAG: hypothetical protein A2Y21_12015 [Clostridiales bacterium GWC2_40_7]
MLDRVTFQNFIKQWAWRISAGLVWLIFLRGTFGCFSGIPNCGWIDIFSSVDFAVYRYLIYCGLVVLLMLIKRFTGASIWMSIGFIAYVVFFPLVLFFLVVASGLRVLTFTTDSIGKVFVVFGSNCFLAISVLVWPIVAKTLLSYQGEFTGVLMLILGLIGLRVFIEVLVNAAVPLFLIDKAARWVGNKMYKSYTEEWILEGDLMKLDDKAFCSKIDKLETENKDLREMAKSFTEFVKEHERPYLAIGVFLLLFFLAFVVAWGTYAVEFLALSRIDPSAFEGMPVSGILDSAYMSLMWICTSSPDGYIANSGYAKLIVALETFTGISILTLLVVCFSAIMTHHLNEGRETLETLLRDIDKAISERGMLLLTTSITERRAKVCPASTKKVETP